MQDAIYLDYNATTPIDPEAAQAMIPFLYGHFGNPSSSHTHGRDARRWVDLARQQIAGLLQCDPAEVLFTSGGTESNNHAIKGVAFSHQERGNHIITSVIEHPAVLEVCEWLSQRGFRITRLPVDAEGLVNPASLEQAIDSRTILVSIMHANNETGAIQPVRQLAQIAHRHGALMHTDAAQSLGKIPVDVQELEVDLLTLAGHKLYAPKGIGALYLRAGVVIEKFMHGAGHEGGRRAGTENVLEIVGLGKACEVAQRDLEKNRIHYQTMRDRLHAGLKTQFGSEKLRLNGPSADRLPNTLNLSFFRVEANTLLDRISGQVSASAGAACHAGNVQLSAVLQAMQTPLPWAMGAVRFSVGRGNTFEQVDRAVEIIAGAVADLPASGDMQIRQV